MCGCAAQWVSQHGIKDTGRAADSMNLVSEAGFAIVTLAAVLSCSGSNVGTDQKWLTFRCPGGQTVMARFEPQDDFVNVRFEGRELQLPHVISGSGARYSDGKATFWNKGDSALVEIDNRIVVQDCIL